VDARDKRGHDEEHLSCRRYRSRALHVSNGIFAIRAENCGNLGNE